MHRVEIMYKGAMASFDVPEDWNIVKTCTPHDKPALPDIRAALKMVLNHPVGCEPLAKLAKSKKIAILSDDVHRPTPCHLLIPPLLDELNRFGVKDNDVTVIVAGGMHVSPPEEIKRKFGSELMKRVNIITHDPHQNLRFMGTTSRGTPVFINEIAADAGLRIGIGGIKGAHFAGYSGGPKIILPGISGDKTILHNHLMFRDENCKLCKLDGNPIWEDMLEAARLAHLDMKIDVVLNTRNEVALISAGEAEQAQKAAVKFFNEIYRIPVPKQADVEIVAGYPLDRELGQSLLAVVTNREVVRDGGTFLVASAAPGGIMEGFAHPLKLGLTSDDIMDQMTKGGQSPSGGPGISRFMEIKEKKAVYVVSDGISKEQVVGMNLRHASTLSEGVMELAATYPSADVIISPTCMVLPYVQN